MSSIYDDIKEALSPLKNILNTSKELDSASTGALVATTGGCVVVGFVFGGILWMPFAMAGSLLGYRLFRHYAERDQRKIANYIQLINLIKERQQSLWESDLPDEQKQYLSDKLNRLLEEGQINIALQLPASMQEPLPLQVKNNPDHT